jgi:hypothetical protein
MVGNMSLVMHALQLNWAFRGGGKLFERGVVEIVHQEDRSCGDEQRSKCGEILYVVG